MRLLILNFAIFIAFVLALLFLFYREKFTHTEKIFGYFLISNAIFEILAKLVNILNFNNNLPGLHAYTLIKFILLGWFLGAVIGALGFVIKCKPILILGSLAIVLNSIFIQDIFSFNSYSATAVELFVVITSIAIILMKLNPKLEIQIDLKPVIIFTIACFIKSCFSIMIYLYSTEIAKMVEEIGIKIWVLNGLINIIASCIILYAITLIIKREKKPKYIIG